MVRRERLPITAATSQQKVCVMNLLRNGLASFPRRLLPLLALVSLFGAVGATWRVAPAAAKPTVSVVEASRTAAAAKDDDEERPVAKVKAKKELSGKLNLNTATAEQLQLLPTVGPSKAERILEWRKKNGSFKRAADLRKVKGFGYKTLKRLEPYLDVSGATTLAQQ
jgi:competence protein ComEA